MPGDSGQQETPENTRAADAADIVIAVLTYSDGAPLSGIAGEAWEYLSAVFPDRRVVVVTADGGSLDSARENVPTQATGEDGFLRISYPVSPAQRISPDYFGVPGKANGVRAVLHLAADLKAAGCVIVDSSTSALAGEWLAALIRPVIDDGIDFVAPEYLRHKYQGTILNGILYPLCRALYGRRFHPPIAGSYALSAKLMSYLESQQWPPGTATSSATDTAITVQSLCGSFRVAKVVLDQSALHPREPAPEVSTILTQILGSVFAEMTRSSACWQKIRGSQLVPSQGPGAQPPAEPGPVDPSPMWQSFLLGYKNLRDIYSLVLPPGTMMELNRMSRDSAEKYRFDGDLWARIVYDFALAWRMRIMDRDHLLGALTPLYLGWAASWIHAVRDASPAEVWNHVDALCLAYETQKSYLISRWRWPDRFNP